jgi:hypothetical protein
MAVFMATALAFGLRRLMRSVAIVITPLAVGVALTARATAAGPHNASLTASNSGAKPAKPRHSHSHSKSDRACDQASSVSIARH